MQEMLKIALHCNYKKEIKNIKYTCKNLALPENPCKIQQSSCFTI